jgi:hypothetical protein
MILMQAIFITRATGRGGPWVFCAPIGNHIYRLGAISQKNSISRAQPLPLAQVMDAARIKSITHGAV